MVVSPSADADTSSSTIESYPASAVSDDGTPVDGTTSTSRLPSPSDVIRSAARCASSVATRTRGSPVTRT